MTREEQVEPTWLDRGPGSGSNSWSEDMADANSREPSNDGRSRTRTTFYDESDSSPPTVNRTWEHLAALNDGMRSPDRSRQNHKSEQTRFIKLLCSELECSEHQTERVRWVIEDIDNLREFFPTAPYEHIILAAISLVVDEDTTDFDNWIVRRGEFQEIMDAIDMEMSRLWTLREKLREETAIFDG